MKERLILSTSINESTGGARIIIEGAVPAPYECDDPIVELFRPVRNKYRKDIFFAITVKHADDEVICDILASNGRGRDVNDFLRVAIATLGSEETRGVIKDYVSILKRYFEDEEGLKVYLDLLEEAKKTDDEEEAIIIYKKCNNSIKAFVEKAGLPMPSLRKIKERQLRAKERLDLILGKTPAE